jgi:DNA-binding beta-propeller fold protein YncE
MKTIFAVSISFAALLMLAPQSGAQQPMEAQETSPLLLTAQIPLPGVRGRFDHFTFDPAEPGRVFISALGNNSVEVLNLVEGLEIHRISNIPDPQGIAFAVGLNKLFVGSRQGKLYIYDGKTYDLITSIDYQADVDNLRYDAATKRVYAGYGDGDTAAIGMVDATTNQRVEETYKTGAHPESYQLERSSSKMYANVPDLKRIDAIDRASKKITWWPIPEGNDENFPMALDEADHRLFIVTRTPPRLMVFDTNAGKMVASLPCVGDVDDLYYDANHKRVYIPGGQGYIDVFQQKDADHYQHLAKVPSAIGARTAGYAAKLGKKGQDRFFLAVPIAPGREASVWVYTVQE